MTFAAVICDADDPCSVNAGCKNHLEVQIDLYTFGVLDFHVFTSCFLDHLFLVSDFRQIPRRNFLKFFPILCPLLLLLQVFSSLEK